MLNILVAGNLRVHFDEFRVEPSCGGIETLYTLFFEGNLVAHQWVRQEQEFVKVRQTTSYAEYKVLPKVDEENVEW